MNLIETIYTLAPTTLYGTKICSLITISIKKIIPPICSEPALWQCHWEPLYLVLQKAIKNKHSLHACSTSFLVLQISHLLQLKLVSAALFNSSLSVNHTLPLSISMFFSKLLVLSMCGLVASAVHRVPARYGSTADYKAAQLLLLWFPCSFL